MTYETVGYWTVNGVPFCQSHYHEDLANRNRVDFKCACTEKDYEHMSKDLKEMFPDGSNHQVFTTKWYPVPCPGEQVGIPQTTRTYVDLALFRRALDTLTNGLGNTFTYEINTIQHPDFPPVITKIVMNYSRYTMNPMGFHIGYEDYMATLEVSRKRTIERNSMQMQIDAHAEWLVDLDTLSVRIAHSPEPEECTCLNNIECECEMYTGPDEDFAYEEMRHFVDQALNVSIRWTFNDGKWFIYNYATGEDWTDR